MGILYDTNHDAASSLYSASGVLSKGCGLDFPRLPSPSTSRPEPRPAFKIDLPLCFSYLREDSQIARLLSSRTPDTILDHSKQASQPGSRIPTPPSLSPQSLPAMDDPGVSLPTSDFVLPLRVVPVPLSATWVSVFEHDTDATWAFLSASASPTQTPTLTVDDDSTEPETWVLLDGDS